jgi:zona occludens toxin (predicted ATPase)
MIVGFVGTPGSGKTYEAVKKIVFNLRKGRHVYTNIDGMDQGPCKEMIKSICNFDDWEFDKHFHFLTKDEVPKFWEVVRNGSFIVLDEIHKVFNCRDWQSSKNNAFADWASTHRHYGFDLVLITQDMEKVEKQVRSLLEWTYVFRKVNFFGGAVQKKYLCYSFSGDDTHGKPLATNVRTYEQQYFRCYKSYATSDAKEVGFMRHVNVLRHPVFLILPVVLCVSLYLLFGKSSLASGDLFGRKKIQEKQDKIIAGLRVKNAASVPDSSPSPPISSAPVAFKPISSNIVVQVQEWKPYRIEGYIKGPDEKITVLINGISMKIPSPYLQKCNFTLRTCLGRYSILGDEKQVSPGTVVFAQNDLRGVSPGASSRTQEGAEPPNSAAAKAMSSGEITKLP